MSAKPDSSFPRASAALPYLTNIIQGSAPFITTFLLIHLTAPIIANVGGSSLASQTMVSGILGQAQLYLTHQTQLLGREYYQTGFGEKYLVLGPLAVHALAGITKRIISPTPRTSPRPWSSLLTLTGYAAMFLFVPIHFMTHRVHPTTVSAPILALGPSELDYEFVKFGLRNWPWKSWLLYTGLVAGVVLHAVDGMGIIWNTRFSGALGRLKESSRKTRIAAAVGGVVLPVLSGLYMLSSEPFFAFASMTRRFEAAFTTAWIYRI